MIELNLHQEIVRIESWNDMVQRPGFTPNIDPQKSKLKEIIGRYNLPKSEEVHCGLPCNRAHQKGYLVTTKDGHLTNIGHICGDKHFGVKFGELAKSFDREMERKDRRERVKAFASDLSIKRDQFERLKETSLRPIYCNGRPLTKRDKGVPEPIVSFFRNAARTLSGEVRMPRIATRSEHELMEMDAGNDLPSPQFVDELIATISGIEFFKPSLDIRENKLVIESLFDELEDCDIDNKSDGWLKKTVVEISRFKNHIRDLERAIDEACKLLNQKNLAPLKLILEDRAERDMFSIFVANLPHGHDEACAEYREAKEVA